jgi:hypothetical protein
MNRIKMNIVNDVWCVETTFYGVHVVAHDSHLQMALRGLKSAMSYIERELVTRVGGA